MRPSLVRRAAAAVLIVWGLLSAGCDDRTRESNASSPTAAETAAAAQPIASAAMQKPGAPSVPDVLVTPAWLQEQLTHDTVTIIDARAADKFAAAHIAGAVNVPSAVTVDPSPDLSQQIAPLDKIQRVFSDAGVIMNRPVIVYDDGSDYRDAARVFYVLEVHGHPAVAVLNGGLAAWRNHSSAVTDAATRVRPSQFIPNMQPDLLATKLTVARAIRTGDAVVVDSRSAEEYVGHHSVASRAGHVPKAINVQATDAMENRESLCAVKYGDDLLKVYASLPRDRKIITYCNTGTRASINYLALRHLKRRVAVYDGSWTQWGNDPNLPIETGPGGRAGTRPAATDGMAGGATIGVSSVKEGEH